MPDGKKVQPAKRGKISNPWVFARKITQTAAFTAFVLTVVFTRFNGLEPAISALPVRLSPLAMFAHLLSSRTFLAGSTISLVILISSFVVGRAWCGWLCPMGTILDVFSFNHSRIKKQLPDNWRKLKYGLLIVTLVSAVFSNLTLLFFDPITLFVRTITVTVLPVIDQITFAVEKLFIKVPFLSGPVSKFDSLIRPAIFPSEPSTFVYAFTFGLFFTGLILLNLIAERFWCRYLCPLGAMLGLASKIALIQRRLESPCAECGLCSKKCPTGTINPALNFKSDPSECTLCMECQQRCAKGSQSFPARWQPARFNSYDPDRRLFLGSLGLSIFSLALLNIGNKRQDAKDHLLRPPGVDGATFLSKCVRCGICVKVCPTQALQFDLTQTGVEGFGTPVLVPRYGFCQYSCNACGLHCPVEAIPPLKIDEKKKAVIGHAYIDHNRCIAWGDHLPCIVCQEMCPLPQKAITLEKGSPVLLDGYQVEVKLPVVDRSICIGCGTCENKCPVTG
jgi:MauM/NapG family ferredoxin protein